jgi:hypothetical protein
MYTKRYTPPTCTLELTAKKSPVINTGQKPWEFNLRLDDPRLPEEEHITITGDRTQLNSLHDAVNNYIQKFLAYPAVENMAEKPAVNNSALTVQQHFAIPDHTDIYLQPRNLLIHDLCLGKLTTNQAIASIPLSVLQLFDLSTVLNECQTDLVTELDDEHQSVPAWLKSVGLIFLTAGFTALAIKGYDYYVTSQKPAEEVVTMPNIPSPSPVVMTPSPSPKISPTASPSPLPKSLKPSPIPVPPTLFGGPGGIPMTAPNFANQSGSFNNQSTNQNDDRMVMVIPTDETNNPGDRRSVLTIDAPDNNMNSVPFVPPTSPVVSPPLPVPPIPPPNLGINLTPTTSIISSDNPMLPSRQYLDVKQLPIMMPGQIDLPVLVDQEDDLAALPDDLSNNSPDDLPNVPKKSQATDKFPEEPLFKIVEPKPSQPTEYVAEKNTLFDQIPQVSQVRGYFEETWQPPADLTKSLQYNLTIDQTGKVQSIKPVGETAVKYSKQAKLPKIGEVMTSNLTSTQPAIIRVVLQPDGKVQTFLQ